MPASRYFASGNTAGLTGLFSSFDYFERNYDEFYFIVLYVPSLGYGSITGSFEYGGVLESVRKTYSESLSDYRQLQYDAENKFNGIYARVVMFKWNNGRILNV